MLRPTRILALIACVAMLAAVGCRGGKPKSTEEPSPEPTETPGAESLGDFQLVGSIEQAFVSADLPIELPFNAFDDQPSEGTEDRSHPGVGGVARVSLQAFSDELRDKCGADEGDRFNMYWTTESLFDSNLLTRDFESTLEGRRVGVLGTIYSRPGGAAGDNLDINPSPSESPASTPAATPQGTPGITTGEGEDDCILLALQVGVSAGGALPTAAPHRRATPSPSHRVTDTAHS